MSVMIKGMQLPSECSECLFSVGEPAQCIVFGEHSARYSRLKNCPLVEISTPHGRLIDADNLKCPLSWQGEIVRATVREAPTIIEAEVSE